MDSKKKVAVIFGGRSGEHEISLQSAASVVKNLDRSRYEVIGIGIDPKGHWRVMPDADTAPESIGKALHIDPKWPEVMLQPFPPKARGAVLLALDATRKINADVLFPVMHGPLCEDGSIQGLFELADAPYVGCGVMSSAVGMDKEVAKRLVDRGGLKVVPWITAYASDMERDARGLVQTIHRELGFPCFVKPVNLGSSVGVHKVKDVSHLENAFADAFRYDSKVLIEKAIDAREIEVSVLEARKPGDEPRVSLPGEIIPTHEFYSYESKYLDENGAHAKIPAEMTTEQINQVQKMAAFAFRTLGCEGFARADFFLDKKSGEIYFNEVNTIPGFTSISMYPKMWEASGLGYAALLTELVELALRRADRRAKLVREFHA